MEDEHVTEANEKEAGTTSKDTEVEACDPDEF